MKAAWQARICDRQNRVLGAGFLLPGHRVLTCAHVVAEADLPLRVHFPAEPQLAALDVTVVDSESWYGAGDRRGDVAVLYLPAHPRLPEPARLGAADCGRGTRVRALGYPRKHAQTGRWADTEVVGASGPGHEWYQLNGVSVTGGRVEKGFSGAAAVDTDDTVVGMVVATDTDEAAKIAWMIPLPVITRYQPSLLVPPVLSTEDRMVLRAVASSLSPADLLRLHGEYAGRHAAPPRREPTTVEGLALALAELVSAAPLGRLLYDLAAGRHGAAVPGCREIADRIVHRAGAARREPPHADRAAREAASVVVQIAQSAGHADRYLLTIWIQAHDGAAEKVYSGFDTLSRGDVWGELAARLPVALEQLLRWLRTFGERDEPPDVMVEFLVARDLLAVPFDELPASARRPTPLGRRYPVVVRDLERMSDPECGWHWERRWKSLHRRPDTPIDWVDCRDQRGADALDGWFHAEPDRAVLGLASAPDAGVAREALDAGLYAGVPVAVWRRDRCAAHGAGRCDGDRFATELTAALAGETPHRLPHRVQRLRAEAAGAGPGHCGHRLSLLYDDPRRRPEPEPAFAAPME